MNNLNLVEKAAAVQVVILDKISDELAIIVILIGVWFLAWSWRWYRS